MAYQLGVFAGDGEAGGVGLGEALLVVLLAEYERVSVPVMHRLWAYYRNPMEGVGRAGAAAGAGGRDERGRTYRLGQERGLPARLVGRRDAALDDRAGGRREIVVENDIGWRIHTMVDFMVGRPVRLVSTARDGATRRRIERALGAVWDASGGITLMQDMALLGHVYGHVDLLVRSGSDAGGAARGASPETGGSSAGEEEGALPAEAAGRVRVEIVEPTRGVALLNPRDYRRIDAYIVRFRREGTQIEGGAPGALRGWLGRWTGHADGAWPGGARRGVVTVTEILSGAWRQVYEDAGDGPRLVEEGPNQVSPGETPVVHIQNVGQPFAYEGLGEVEPLIPLQDELNTRLSDRASRVTMQSFKMYLATGIDGFEKSPIGPGQVWSTDNPDARIEAFGGDAASPSEERHIEEVREALDKASAVPPLASGVVRAKIGNLTSENALRVTLMGLLSKTARKRITYGRGLAEASRLVLGALDEAGVLATDPADRGVRVEWPDPLGGEGGGGATERRRDEATE